MNTALAVIFVFVSNLAFASSCSEDTNSFLTWFSKMEKEEGPAKIDPDLAKVENISNFGEKLQEIGVLTDKIFANCPQARLPVGNLARLKSFPTKAKTKPIEDKIRSSLIECKCKVDFPSVRKIVFLLGSDPHPDH
jgi:hypothetical protein